MRMRLMMRVVRLTLSLALVVPSQAEEPPIRYAFQVFQLTGGFTQKTSLAQNVWQGSDAAWIKIKDDVLLFDEGEFLNGKDRLVMTPKGCFWNDRKVTFENGHKAKLPNKKIKMIYSPNLIRREKELVRLKIASKLPYQYMEARKDGLFKLKEVKLPTGLDIEIKAQRAEPNVYDVTYMELDLRSVHRREKSTKTTLPVGKPILEESEYILKLRVQEYRSYGILLRPKGTDNVIIVRFEVDDE